MNTLIYLWIEPMVMNHQRHTNKVYFNAIFPGEHYSTDKSTLNEVLEGNRLASVMDFAGIDCNWDYSAVSAVLTNDKPTIEFADSPKQKKIKLEVAKVLNSKDDIPLQKDSINVEDNGQLTVRIPKLGINEKIDFPKIWESIEKSLIGKLQEGDEIKLTDDDGNILFEIQGGSFIAPGNGDLVVKTKDGSIKGGLYIRDDGSIDIGDWDRTVYVKIYTNKLLKASLKLNKSLMDITSMKLLTGQTIEHENKG